MKSRNVLKHLLAHTSVLLNGEDGNVIERHWKCHKPVVEEISGNIPAVRFSKASPIIFSLSTEQYQRFMLTERKRQEKAFECLVHINNR